MVNYKKCCRLCLKDEELLQNFDCRDAELCAKINQHFDVLISEYDELSTKICQECASKVYNFAVFYNSVQLNQQHLKFCMDIQKKVSEIKEEDDDCIIIEVETDDIVHVPNTENRIMSSDSNESINSTRKRSANDTPTTSKNNKTKRQKSLVCSMNNIQSTSNNIIATKHDTLNTKVEKETLTTNEVVKDNFEIINMESIKNSEIPCFLNEMTNSLKDLHILRPKIKIKKKLHQKLINKIRLLELSDKNKKILKRYKCKNSYVKLERLSTLENKLNQINILNDLNVSGMTDKNIERQTLNLNNIKRLTVDKIKGKFSKELIQNNTALRNREQPENSSEKLSHPKNIQILKSNKTITQNNKNFQKKSSKQNISSNKCSIASNDETNNKKSIELKNTRSSMHVTTDDKNKTIKIPNTEIIEPTNCTTAIKEIDTNSSITKSINNTETIHQTQKQQLLNVQQIPVILNADDSKFVTVPPTNIQSSNEQPEESFSIDLNANQFESMMKQTENLQSSTPNVLISTTENTSTSRAKIINQNSTCSTASTESPELPKLPVRQPIIKKLLQLPQKVLTTATITKPPINNNRKAPAELYTRHLFPPKLPNSQSLNETFYWQNQIQTSNGNNETQSLPTISTSPVVVVPSTLQPATPIMSTIQQQHLNTSTTFTTIAPRTLDLSYLAVYNKAAETSGGMIPTVNSGMIPTVNKNIVITKNLQSINTVQKSHTQNNQQQLQRNNFNATFKPRAILPKQTAQQQIQNALHQNQTIINKKSTRQQQNLQINNSNQQQIQQYNIQQQIQQNSQTEKQSPYLFQHNSTGRVKILTVPELNQKAANNQLLYNKLPVSSTSVTPSTTSFSQISSYASIQPISQQQQISKNNLTRTKIVATLPNVHADNSTKPRISVKILVHSENKNQLTIKLNNLATGKLCHYWDLSEQQKEAVKQSLSAIDKKSVEKFKPYQLDDYAKNLLDRINFIEFRNNFAL